MFCSTIACPESLRVIASKPARSLNVLEKSLLAAHGRLREDDSTLAMLSLYPTMIALSGLISRLLAVDLLSLDSLDRDVSSSFFDLQIATCSALTTIRVLLHCTE